MAKLESINLLGREWKIKRVKRIMIEGVPCDGVTLYDSATIKIRINPDKEIEAATLFHELCHAALFMAGHNNMLSEQQEEAIIRALEHALFPHVKLKCLEEAGL